MFYTIVHALLTLVLVQGVLFSNTMIQMVAVLSCLLILLFMIRQFDGCFLTSFEGEPALSDIGIVLSLGKEQTIQKRQFEEILVSNLLQIHLIKMISLSILPIKILF